MRSNRDPLILAGVGAVLVICFLFGMWIPYRRSLTGTRTQIRDTQVQLTKYLHQAARPHAEPTKPQSDVGVSEAEIELAIPVGAELGPLLTQIGEDLQDESVADQQVQARPVLEGGDFSRIPLTLRFKGTYGALFKFLQRVESRERIVRIDRLGIRRDKASSDETVQVDIELSTYFRKSAGGDS